MHVVDVEFLEHATIGPLSVVYNELVEMATFAMMIPCDRAKRRGVRDAGSAVREGDTREQLLQFAIEAHADLMIIGRPSPRRYGSALPGGEANAFAAQIEEQAGIKVLQVDPAGA